MFGRECGLDMFRPVASPHLRFAVPPSQTTPKTSHEDISPAVLRCRRAPKIEKVTGSRPLNTPGLGNVCFSASVNMKRLLIHSSTLLEQLPMIRCILQHTLPCCSSLLSHDWFTRYWRFFWYWSLQNNLNSTNKEFQTLSLLSICHSPWLPS